MKKTKYGALTLAVSLIGLDQLIKWWAEKNLRGAGQIHLIPGVLDLTYTQNPGAAFGIMQDNTALLALLTGIVLFAALYYIFSDRLQNGFLTWTIMLVVAGGVGNFIDRIFRGYVVDYLDVRPLFDFPIFNLADCCVVVGTGLLLIHILFFDRKKKNHNQESVEEPESSASHPEQEGD